MDIYFVDIDVTVDNRPALLRVSVHNRLRIPVVIHS